MGDPSDSELLPLEKGANVGTSTADGSFMRPQPPGKLDLQYVSIQLDGITFDGWYRLLPDGKVELMARGYLIRGRLPEGTLHEQAEAMLSEVIRAKRLLAPT